MNEWMNESVVKYKSTDMYVGRPTKPNSSGFREGPEPADAP